MFWDWKWRNWAERWAIGGGGRIKKEEEEVEEKGVVDMEDVTGWALNESFDLNSDDECEKDEVDITGGKLFKSVNFSSVFSM